MRWLSRRFSAKVAAALLALAVAAPALAVIETAATCCCPVKKANCHCPVCNHARELASGDRHVEPCGGSRTAALLPSLPSVPPPLIARGAPLPLPLPASRPLFSMREPPLHEVPTPPPLD